VGGAIITIALNVLWIPWIGFMGSAWATFICYFAMMIASYYIGQKHYPVKYELPKNIFYLLLAVALYLLSVWIYPESKPLRLTVNSIILAVYLLVIGIMERRALKKIINKN
jgi:O-antigen/teichoic acid export membrane protein